MQSFEELKKYIFKNPILVFEDELSTNIQVIKTKGYLQQIEKAFKDQSKTFLNRLFRMVIYLLAHTRRASDIKGKYWREKLVIAIYQNFCHVYHTSNNKLYSLEEKIQLIEDINLANQTRQEDLMSYYIEVIKRKLTENISTSLIDFRRSSKNPILYNFIQIGENQFQVEFILQIQIKNTFKLI